MEQDEPLHVGDTRHVHGVLDRAVAPAGLGRIVGGVVLGVVDDEIRVAEERGVAPVPGVEEVRFLERPAVVAGTPGRALVGLMVGRVDECAAGA